MGIVSRYLLYIERLMQTESHSIEVEDNGEKVMLGGYKERRIWSEDYK